VRGKGPVSGQRRTKGATLLSDAGTAKNRLFSISGKMTGVCPSVLSGKSFRFGYLRDIDYGNIRNGNTFSSDYLEWQCALRDAYECKSLFRRANVAL
jgi:hypothetical protein